MPHAIARPGRTPAPTELLLTRVMGRRLLAFVLDYAVAMVAVRQIRLLVPDGRVDSWNITAAGALMIAAPVILRGIFQATIGRSPFQAALGLRLVSDGRPTNVLARTAVQCVTVAVPVILLISVLMAFDDPRRRMLHDRAGHTLVVRSRPTSTAEGTTAEGTGFEPARTGSLL